MFGPQPIVALWMFFFLMQKLVEEIVPLGPCLMLSMKPFSPLLVMFHGYCLYCTIRNIPIHHYQKSPVNHRLGGGFKIFFIFPPFWGRFPIWLFRWVVQPPTSSNMLLSRCLAGFLQFTNSILRWNWLDWCQDPQDGDGMISPCSSLATLPLEEAHDSPKAEKYVDRIRICTPPKTDMDTNNSHSWQENHLPNFFLASMSVVWICQAIQKISSSRNWITDAVDGDEWETETFNLPLAASRLVTRYANCDSKECDYIVTDYSSYI